jgi:hypothetical protein
LLRFARNDEAGQLDLIVLQVVRFCCVERNGKAGGSPTEVGSRLARFMLWEASARVTR